MDIDFMIASFQANADKIHRQAEKYFHNDKELCAVIDSHAHMYEYWAMKLRTEMIG